MTSADPRRELFRNANFRWLMGGGLLSALGDQFTLLALPWLVLSLSAALRVLDVTQLFTAAALCLLSVVALGAFFTPIRRIRYAGDTVA